MANQISRVGGPSAPPRRADPVGAPNGVQTPSGAPTGVRRGAAPGGAVGFTQLLQQQVAQTHVASPRLRFSAHAQTRLQQRAIPFGPAELARLEAAVEQAHQKGGRESLILMNELALVVSIKNHTVVTAVETQQAQQNVFTNIDSVVIASTEKGGRA